MNSEATSLHNGLDWSGWSQRDKCFINRQYILSLYLKMQCQIVACSSESDMLIRLSCRAHGVFIWEQRSHFALSGADVGSLPACHESSKFVNHILMIFDDKIGWPLTNSWGHFKLCMITGNETVGCSPFRHGCLKEKWVRRVNKQGSSAGRRRNLLIKWFALHKRSIAPRHWGCPDYGWRHLKDI